MEKVKLNIAKVSNMTNANGTTIPNQLIVSGKDFTAFQSYDTIIAVKKNGKTYLDAEMWDYSQTTGKYRNQFLGMDKKETLKAIKAGTIILADLNT